MAATSDRVDRLVWNEVEVAGRPAVYGVGGDGLPVLFLHGWALGHRSYKRALRRLATKGCRVYAPALPGFGGTAELPTNERNLDGYARWVGDFLDTVGVTDPVFLLGHSFGGGVSIAFAHRFTARTRYLVLMNSVGTPTGSAGRPLWNWVWQLSRELYPPRQGFEMLKAAAEDLVPNLVTSPRTLWDVGQLARHADLSAEISTLRARDVPVLVLSSDHDGVIPVGSFESLCAAIGVEGRVVEGRHTWLLADPDTFGEVLDNVVGVQVAQHTSSRATASAGEVQSFLARTSMPAGVAADLLAEASPLWVMSEPPAVLAGDLALCHPPLAPDEVRAVARPFVPERDTATPAGPHAPAWRLTVVAHDRPGLLADTAAVLARSSLSITSASAMTFSPGALALHALVVEADHAVGPDAWDAIGAQLGAIVHDGAAAPRFAPIGRAVVTSNGDAVTGRWVIRVSAPDQIGLLWAICRWMADHDINIEVAHAAVAGRHAQGVFVVGGECVPAALAEVLSRQAWSPLAPLGDAIAGVRGTVARAVNRWH